MFSKTSLTRLLRVVLLLVLCGSVLLTSGPGVKAAPAGTTFNVNSTADVPDWNPGDGVCETAQYNGICTLRAAVQEANAYAGSDTINLQAGADYVISRPGVDDTAYNGDLDITDKLIINGAGASVSGGGIDRVFDVPGSYIFVTINNLFVYDGDVTGDGGGIRNRGILTLSKVGIIFNHAAYSGGGLANEGSTALAVLTNSNVSTNVAGSDGGGIFNIQGMVSIIGTTIIANKGKAAYGGGIANYLGNVALKNSLVESNTSDGNGGGISTGGNGAAGADLTVINSTVANNIAASNGGWIYNNGGSAAYPSTVYLYNATIEGNVAVNYSGGGISLNENFASYLELWNTLIANNRRQSNAGPLQDCSGTLNSQDYNFIRTTSGCTISGLTAHNKTNIQALLGNLDYNGGPTRTLLLLPGSPAIDGGNPAGCIDDHGAPITFDQRGFMRPAGAHCDIGAYESDSLLLKRKLFLPLIRR